MTMATGVITLDPEERRQLTAYLSVVVGELTMCWSMNDWSADEPGEEAAFSRRLARAEAAYEHAADETLPLTAADVRRYTGYIARMPVIAFSRRPNDLEHVKAEAVRFLERMRWRLRQDRLRAAAPVVD